MALTFCRECRERVSTEARACPHCGAPSPGGVVTAALPPDEALEAISEPPEIAPAFDAELAVAPAKSRSTSIVLAFFLGGVGAQRFYLDRPKEGMLYAFFFWTFIPAFIGLVDALRFASMTDQDFQRELADHRRALELERKHSSKDRTGSPKASEYNPATDMRGWALLIGLALLALLARVMQ